ncbi:MAG: di-trans,poly-cis-decaprenylcistransferase [Nanoarchaeota archaeon]|nr:di-trans,poly-cis-decaprenylcistransferase [Nanoarchaeota archaeon]
MGLHLGLIMDGNRRFAKKLMLEPWKGHDYGAKKLEEVLRWCKDEDVEKLTIYTLSMQNLNRPKHELDYLMNIIRDIFKKSQEKESTIQELGLKVEFIGRRDLLPQDVQDIFGELEKKTKNNTTYTIRFCVAYGGREEMVDAVHLLAKDIKEGKIQPEQVDEDLIDSYVYMKDQPDLIIRTGGDHRTSNFLIWQSAYSEWLFYDKTWPELTQEDIQNAIDDFQGRERRFGR